MPHPLTIQNLLSRVPETSEDHQFWEAIYDLLTALSLPQEEAYGYAAILALELADIHLRDGRKIGTFGVEGGIEDLCQVVAVVFASVSPDPRWWKCAYPQKMSHPTVRKILPWLNKKIEELEIVENYSPWIT